MNSPKRYPVQLGYRWPAEWESHTATWIAWPHNVATWPGRFSGIPSRFAEMIRTLAQYEPIHVLAGGANVMQQAEEMVGDLPNVILFDIPTNDAWVRDYGPTYLQGQAAGDLAIIDWTFNSWGGKYPPWDLDDRVPSRVAAHQDLRRFCPDIVLEGGSIDGNGQGLVLTTETCLLDPQRNTMLDRRGVEQALSRYCAATEVIWIPGGPIAGDDTDGHIDQLARFVGQYRIAVAVETDPQDDNYQATQANVKALRAYQTRSEMPLEIIPLPMPRALYFDQHRAPGSYCNFYIANRCVLVPQFDDPADDEAIQIISGLFPDRDTIGLPARELAWGLGAFHCLTQQQPAARQA